jgi:hypothetical protein
MNRLQSAVSNQFPQLRVSQSADLPSRGYCDGERLQVVGSFRDTDAHSFAIILNKSPRAGANARDIKAKLSNFVVCGKKRF